MKSSIAKTGKLPGDNECIKPQVDETFDFRSIHLLLLHAAASLDERLQETNSFSIGVNGFDFSPAEKGIDVKFDCVIGVVFFVAFRVLSQVH